MRQRIRMAVLVGAVALRLCAASTACKAQKLDEKIAVYEKAIQNLQGQIDQLKREIAALRAASGTAPRVERAGVFGYMQSQFENTAPKGANRFFMRRVRFGVRGQLDAGFSYEIQADAAASTGILRNVWIDYAARKGSLPLVRFGQLKLPYSLESIESGSATPLIERAIAVDQLAFSHDRDSGIGLSSRADPERPFAYALSLTNGAGRNQFAATRNKLFAGRVQINTSASHPLFGGSLAVGLSTRQGHVVNLNQPAGGQQEAERYGADLDFQSQRWRLRGEYLWGRNQAAHPEGYYGLLAYRPTAPMELLLRYEGFSLDDHGPSLHRTTLGLTYLFSKSTKGMLNYEVVDRAIPGFQSSGVRLRLQTLFP